MSCHITFVIIWSVNENYHKHIKNGIVVCFVFFQIVCLFVSYSEYLISQTKTLQSKTKKMQSRKNSCHQGTVKGCEHS